jgi:CxxC-x17-CxxC domain-containing protein
LTTVVDKEITCNTCGTVFSFGVEEQEFYLSKGFQEPRKCKPCRDFAKQNRNGGNGNSYGKNRPPREMFDAVCATCGINTQVPFQPNGTKPVYCRDCYQSNSYAY